MPAIIGMSVWQGLPANTIIFLAGLQAIPSVYYDAASVDGGGRWARLRHVTLPLLTPSIFFTGVLSLIGSAQVFDQVFVLANPGKPTNATITIVYFIYEAGFRNFKMGYASAASWILFLIVAVLTFIYFRSQRRWVPLPVSALRACEGGAVRASGRVSVRRARFVIRRVGLYAALIGGGLLMMIPFFWMALTSLKTRAEVFASPPLSLPSGAHWENYVTMWTAFGDVTFGTFFLNSVKLATLNMVGQVIACSLAAYAFAVIGFRGRGVIFGVLLATMISPFTWFWSRTSSCGGTCPTRSARWQLLGTHVPLLVGPSSVGHSGSSCCGSSSSRSRRTSPTPPGSTAPPWRIFRRSSCR